MAREFSSSLQYLQEKTQQLQRELVGLTDDSPYRRSLSQHITNLRRAEDALHIPYALRKIIGADEGVRGIIEHCVEDDIATTVGDEFISGDPQLHSQWVKQSIMGIRALRELGCPVEKVDGYERQLQEVGN